MLAGMGSPPQPREIESQTRLHKVLRGAVQEAAEYSSRLENRFPELVRSIRQYAVLLSYETERLDVIGLFGTGGSLAAFNSAYREQNKARTLAEPLEPQTAALLNNISRMHGAFLLGFEEGRLLVERADEFLVDKTVLQSIEIPGPPLLNLFVENRDLVEEDTRRANLPIKDYVTEFGWSSSRVGYSAYALVRNGVYALIRFSIGNDPSALGIASALSAGSWLAGDPNGDFMRAALTVLHLYGTQMLAFFNHSPEFRAYVEWALETMERDRTALSET
jgi:hypothetical protein